jgi:hypothetical protein
VKDGTGWLLILNLPGEEYYSAYTNYAKAIRDFQEEAKKQGAKAEDIKNMEMLIIEDDWALELRPIIIKN